MTDNGVTLGPPVQLAPESRLMSEPSARKSPTNRERGPSGPTPKASRAGEMADRETQVAVVEQFFEGPADLDRLSLLHDDCEWWNGIGKFPGAPGQTVFRGKQEIGDVVLGRMPAPRPPDRPNVGRR